MSGEVKMVRQAEIIAQRGVQRTRGPLPRVTEKQFQSAFVKYLRLMGWTTYHTRYAIGSDPGFPDLVAVRAERCVFLELKTETGRISPAQAEWGELLAGVGGTVEYHLLRATDEGWRFIEQTFR